MGNDSVEVLTEEEKRALRGSKFAPLSSAPAPSSGSQPRYIFCAPFCFCGNSIHYYCFDCISKERKRGLLFEASRPKTVFNFVVCTSVLILLPCFSCWTHDFSLKRISLESRKVLTLILQAQPCLHNKFHYAYQFRLLKSLFEPNCLFLPYGIWKTSCRQSL